MENKNIILDFLQKNYGWIVAVITGASVGISFILRFIKYLYSTLYFDYYGLSYGLFNSNELSILYNFGFSILIMFCFVSLLYCYKQIYNVKKERISIRTILANIILIIILNIIIVLLTDVRCSVKQFIANVIIFIISEAITSYIFFKIDNKEKNKKNDIKCLQNELKIIPFYLVILVFLVLFNYGFEIISNKSYRTINNDKVIVYTTNDYYIVLDCTIEDNKLTIYKGNQTKISNDNVESKLINFDEVKLK